MKKCEKAARLEAVLDKLTVNLSGDLACEAKAYLEVTGMSVRQLEKLYSIGYGENPASVSHHLNCEGGLLAHSVNVTRNIIALSKTMGVRWSNPRSPYVVGMLHDLVKCYCYGRSAHAEDEWTYVKHRLDGKHGEASVIYAVHDLKLDLTDQERRCIKHHMGAYGLDKTGLRRLGRAMTAHPREILCTQTADCMAAYVDENARKR